MVNGNPERSEGQERRVRLTREQLYGSIGSPANQERALNASLPPALRDTVDVFFQNYSNGFRGTTLFEYNNPETGEVFKGLWRGRNKDVVTVRLDGDWKELGPQGNPVYSSVEAIFYRAESP